MTCDAFQPLTLVLGILLGVSSMVLVGQYARGPERWFPMDEKGDDRD